MWTWWKCLFSFHVLSMFIIWLGYLWKRALVVQCTLQTGLFCGTRAVHCVSSWLNTQQVFCRVGKEELAWFQGAHHCCSAHYTVHCFCEYLISIPTSTQRLKICNYLLVKALGLLIIMIKLIAWLIERILISSN